MSFATLHTCVNARLLLHGVRLRAAAAFPLQDADEAILAILARVNRSTTSETRNE